MPLNRIQLHDDLQASLGNEFPAGTEERIHAVNALIFVFVFIFVFLFSPFFSLYSNRPTPTPTIPSTPPISYHHRRRRATTDSQPDQTHRTGIQLKRQEQATRTPAARTPES